MGVEQNILNFTGGIADTEPTTKTRKQNGTKDGKKVVDDDDDAKDMIEITPPNLIAALITENGIMTPAGVSEELIKLWF